MNHISKILFIFASSFEPNAGYGDYLKIPYITIKRRGFKTYLPLFKGDNERIRLKVLCSALLHQVEQCVGSGTPDNIQRLILLNETTDCNSTPKESCNDFQYIQDGGNLLLVERSSSYSIKKRITTLKNYFISIKVGFVFNQLKLD